jgi:hypothetical protein
MVSAFAVVVAFGGCSSHAITPSFGVTPAGSAGASGHATGAAGGSAGVGGSTPAAPDSAGAGGDAATGTAGAATPDAAADAIAVPASLDASGDTNSTHRLVPWTVEADGTDPLIMGIFDTQEKLHCSFLPDATGQLRCMPSGPATYKETAWFSDAACTKRIYTTSSTGAGPAWIGRATALPLPRVACAPNRYVVGTLTSLPADSPHFGGAACAAVTPTPGPGYNLTEMTVDSVEASPDHWEKGTELDGPVFDNVVLKLVQTPDGARFANDLHDTHWDRPCQLAADIANVFCRVATPTSVAGVEGMTCVGPPVWRVPACSDPPFLRSSGGFGGTFAVGAVWGGAVSSNGHGCLQVHPQTTVDGPDTFVTAGVAISAADMLARPWQETGTGRLRLRGLLDDDGQVVTLPTALMWPEFDSIVLQGTAARYADTVANTTCNPIRTPEGLLRCVPPTVNLTFDSGFFADAKCTAPAFYCPNFTDTCPGILAMSASADPNGEVRATKLATSIAAPTVFQGVVQGACTATTFTTPGFYTLGADAAWAQFPVLGERNGRAPEGP